MAAGFSRPLVRLKADATRGSFGSAALVLASQYLPRIIPSPHDSEKNRGPEPMPLTTSARLGPYEVVAPLGVGGMSAGGYASLAAMRSRQRRVGVSSRWGWGPSASENMLTLSPCR